MGTQLRYSVVVILSSSRKYIYVDRELESIGKCHMKGLHGHKMMIVETQKFV